MLMTPATASAPEVAVASSVRGEQAKVVGGQATVTGLAVGGSRVALQFRRHGTRTLANLLGVEGDPLQVRIELS